VASACAGGEEEQRIRGPIRGPNLSESQRTEPTGNGFTEPSSTSDDLPQQGCGLVSFLGSWRFDSSQAHSKLLPLRHIARSARGSAAELEELALGVRRRQGGRPLIRGRRLTLTAQSLKQIASGGMKRVVALELKLFDQRERGG